MTWPWQEPYSAALLEKDPGKLPERLITAEKAILQRLLEMPDAADELPEARALREALDCLYALSPREHPTPGELVDEDDDMTGGNWMRLAMSAGLAVILSLGWVIARNKAGNDAHRSALREEADALANSRIGIIVERTDNPPTGALPHEYRFESRPVRSAPDSRSISKNILRSQNQNPGESPDVSPAVPSEPGDPKSPGGPAQVPSSQFTVDDSAAIANPSIQPAVPPPPQPDEEIQRTPSTATEVQEEPVQEKPQLPRGTVSVNSSKYPSIRVPPELEQEASSSGATLQIGQPIFRVDPTYPEEAERQGVEGTVNLRAIIAKNGQVQNVAVMDGPPLLAAAAVSAVRQWRYEPTLVGDQPVAVTEDVTIVFRLKNPTTAVN